VADELSSEVYRVLVREQKTMTFATGKPKTKESMLPDDDPEIGDLP
jgi:hypothetical protein